MAPDLARLIFKRFPDILGARGNPSLKLLNFYTTRFDTVEINNTFYSLPHEKAK